MDAIKAAKPTGRATRDAAPAPVDTRDYMKDHLHSAKRKR